VHDSIIRMHKLVKQIMLSINRCQNLLSDMYSRFQITMCIVKNKNVNFFLKKTKGLSLGAVQALLWGDQYSWEGSCLDQYHIKLSVKCQSSGYKAELQDKN
jgi:hypothetical protein